jgi:signal transduction histidine kinase/ABC-type amino acid transport substrate-binding protein
MLPAEINMEKHRNAQNVFFFSLCITAVFFAVCSALCPRAASAEETRRTVSVGYYRDGDYMSKTADGDYRGYNIDYLYEIAKYANWKLKFVDFRDFETATSALESGRVDVVPALFYSKERAKKLIFSKNGMGDVYNTLIVRNDNTNGSFNDYGSFRNMRVGVLAATIDALSFRRWDKAKGLGAKITEMHSEKELLGALDDGRIDAVAITYLGSTSKYRIVAEFDPMRMFFACGKSKQAVMDELDNAMDSIKIYNPTFEPAIYKKYFSVNSDTAPAFTHEEQKLIASGKTVRIAIQTDNAPFSYLQNGRPVGAIPDLYAEVAKMSGLKFKYVYAGSMAEAIEKVRNGEADIIAKITENPALALKNNIRLTNNYMTMTMTRVSLKGTQKMWRIGVSGSLMPVYKAQNSDVRAKAMDVRQYANSALTFEALKKKEIDAAYLNTACANYLINNSRTTDYTITALPGYDYAIAAGVGPSAGDTLYQIFNKCLRYTSSMTMNDLVLKYSVAGDDTIASVINRIPATLIGLFVCFMAVIIFALVVLVAALTRYMHSERAMVAEREKTRKEEEELRVAEQANAEKMEFFGNISHDMRTPLNGILGFSDLAKRSDDMDAVKGYLDKIKVSGELLLSLVNDTLTISKLENKKFTLNPETVSSAEIVENLVIPIHSAAAAKNIDFVVDTSKAYSGYINVDKLNVQKIFLNLLTNAVKFTPEGGKVFLTVEDIVLPQNGRSCRVTVRDTGIGMSGDFLPKIFDPFAQEHREKNSNVSGTGLGLAIVKRLIDFMNGTIEVKSELNKGTTFIVTLPVETVKSYEPSEEAEADTSELEGKTVLLCEDNEMNREIATAILRAQKNKSHHSRERQRWRRAVQRVAGRQHLCRPHGHTHACNEWLRGCTGHPCFAAC